MILNAKFQSNKLFKFTAYSIVIGFILLMFLPTSISLRDLFEKQADFITIQGKEVFLKRYPISGFRPLLSLSIAGDIHHFTQITKKQMSGIKHLEKFIHTYLIRQVLDSWYSPSKTQHEALRKPLEQKIFWNIYKGLSQYYDLQISNKVLKDMIEKSYQRYLTLKYKEFLAKKSPKGKFMSKQQYFDEQYEYQWNGYYPWARQYLGDQFKYRVMETAFRRGTLIPNAEVENLLVMPQKSFQMEYALFSYKYFSKTLTKNDAVGLEKEIQEFYELGNQESIVTDKISFSSKEKAQHALSETNLFQNKEHTPKRTFVRKVHTDLFFELKKIPVNGISPILKNMEHSKTNKDAYAIYKIVKQAQSFQEIQHNEMKYNAIMEDYALQHPEKMETIYKNKARMLLEKFLKHLHNAPSDSFMQIRKQDKDFNLLEVAETDWFNMLDAEIRSKAKEEPNKQLEKSKKHRISSHLLTQSVLEVRKYNTEFFTQIQLLKPRETSPIMESAEIAQSDMIQKITFPIFFITRKKQEKINVNTENKTKIQHKVFIQRFGQNQYFWARHLQVAPYNFKVQINIDNILQYLNLDPDELEKLHKTQP